MKKLKIDKDIISPKVLQYYTADEYIKYYNDLIGHSPKRDRR